MYVWRALEQVYTYCVYTHLFLATTKKTSQFISEYKSFDVKFDLNRLCASQKSIKYQQETKRDEGKQKKSIEQTNTDRARESKRKKGERAFIVNVHIHNTHCFSNDFNMGLQMIAHKKNILHIQFRIHTLALALTPL